MVEWNPNMNITLNYDLTLPHIYKHLGNVKFVFLRVNTTVCLFRSFDIEFRFARCQSDCYVLRYVYPYTRKFEGIAPFSLSY